MKGWFFFLMERSYFPRNLHNQEAVEKRHVQLYVPSIPTRVGKFDSVFRRVPGRDLLTLRNVHKARWYVAFSRLHGMGTWGWQDWGRNYAFRARHWFLTSPWYIALREIKSGRRRARCSRSFGHESRHRVTEFVASQLGVKYFGQITLSVKCDM